MLPATKTEQELAYLRGGVLHTLRHALAGDNRVAVQKGENACD